MDAFRLTARQIEKLKALHRKQRDRRFADRIKGVVLLGSGWSVASVSQALLVDEKSVRLWLEKYRQGGVDELLALMYQGKEPSLTEEQQEQLAKHLDENTYLDSNAIRHHKELKSNCGRKRVNINGAVDIDTLETVTDFTKSVNSQSTIRLLKKLEAKHPDAKKIHLIVDNATYYKSKLVKEWLKTSRIKLHFLPGYSPNLNLIERLWKFFKKKILYNEYYETYEEFLAACKNFFRCRTKYRDELRSLLTENFHQYQIT